MYKVLIIDDEPWSRKVVIELVEWEKFGLELVGEAEDGDQGLELIRELKPDIVITDMRMPGVEGVELLREIKEQFPKLKIIVMSGYDDFVYLKQAIRSRAMEYLLKPINPEELSNSLSQCVKELEENSKVRQVSNFFGDQRILDSYLSLRQQILWHMLELDKGAVRNIFEKLILLLKKNISDENNTAIQREIHQDLLFMLREFVSENEIEYIDLLQSKFRAIDREDSVKSISETILEIGQIYVDSVDGIEALRRNRKRVDMNKIQLYIDRHFTEPISLETISKCYFISKEHLSRTFKVYTGENISDYIIRRKMEKAKELITQQRLEIKLAAEMVGYTDLAYFYRVFKKHFDITPGELRKENTTISIKYNKES